ncbi:MAG TPA: LytTR family DNA-binding domain-containing protein [Opitutaceae bacterium]|nr:LytTR family DNA-binding domain-containing protein [Opitutaceae bacterium]
MGPAEPVRGRGASEGAGVTEAGGESRTLAIRKRGRLEFVAPADVVYVRGAGNYAEVVLRDGRRELMDSTMDVLATRLGPEFFRVHRSYLVRVSAVRRVHISPGGRYRAELAGGALLPIGRSRYAALRDRLLR